MFFNRHMFQISALVHRSSTQQSHVKDGGNGLNEVGVSGWFLPLTSLKEPKWHHRMMILAVLDLVCLINAQQLCLILYLFIKKILLSRKLHGFAFP